MAKAIKGGKQKQQEIKISFIKFLFSKEQLYQMLMFLGFAIILYCLLIYMYPYPSAELSDSGSYLKAAFVNEIDSYRPFGYSQFLSTLHGWIGSVHFITFFQYFFNIFNTLFFIFTIKYFFKPKNNLVYLLFAFFSIFSPLSMYLSNTILSDSLFTSLTTLWVTSGLWILYDHKNKFKYIFYFIHLIVLMYLIYVRYTGLVYIAVTITLIFFVFFRKSILISVVLSIIPIVLIFAYYSTQKSKIKEIYHVDTFSGFSGWQMASNALNCAEFIKFDSSDIKDEQVRNFVKYVMKDKALLILKKRPSAGFMWDTAGPLKKYLVSQIKLTNRNYLFEWNYLGENVYNKFGLYVMKKYPFAYIQHFLLPNFLLVFYPNSDDILYHYSMRSIPDDIMKDWYGLEKTKVYSRSNVYVKLSPLLSISRLIIWIIIFIVLIFYFIKRKAIIWKSYQQLTFWLLFVFLFIYSAFSIYAGPFSLRYIAPIHLIQISLIYIFFNSVLNLKKQKN